MRDYDTFFEDLVDYDTLWGFLEALWDSQLKVPKDDKTNHVMFQVKNCVCGWEFSARCCRWGPSDFDTTIDGEPKWNPKDVCDAIFWAFGESEYELAKNFEAQNDSLFKDLVKYFEAQKDTTKEAQGSTGSPNAGGTRRSVITGNSTSSSSSSGSELTAITEMFEKLSSQMKQMENRMKQMQRTMDVDTIGASNDGVRLFR